MSQLRGKIEAAGAEMEHLATSWARISPKRFAKRFKVSEETTDRELNEAWKAIKDLRDGPFRALHVIYSEHTDEHWKNMVAMGCTDLPEFVELKARLKAFREAFYGHSV